MPESDDGMLEDGDEDARHCASGQPETEDDDKNRRKAAHESGSGRPGSR